jgi:hypothetical protein
MGQVGPNSGDRCVPQGDQASRLFWDGLSGFLFVPSHPANSAGRPPNTSTRT